MEEGKVGDEGDGGEEGEGVKICRKRWNVRRKRRNIWKKAIYEENALVLRKARESDPRIQVS